MKKAKIISITGTPGTGKTAVAEILTKRLDANLISINKLLKKGKIPCKTDKKRDTKIIDIKVLQKAINKEIQKNRTNIIDGHLSHLLRSDFVVVLRTNPLILQKRLGRKGWKKSKIIENIQSEIIDEILVEAIEKHGKNRIVEIDTSRKKPEIVASAILNVLNSKSLKNKYSPGKIQWLNKYYRMLNESHLSLARSMWKDGIPKTFM